MRLTSGPVNSIWKNHVAAVTSHAPQMKKFRNIMTESLIRTVLDMAPPPLLPLRFILWPQV